MLYLVILLFIIIAAIQVPGFLKKKLIKELITYLVIMIITLVYSISAILNLHLPGLNKLNEIIFDPVSHLIFPNQQKG